MMLFALSTVAAFAIFASAHNDHEQKPVAGPHQSLWYKAMAPLPGDGGTQVGQASNAANQNR